MYNEPNDTRYSYAIPRQLRHRHSPHRRVIRSCASIGEAFRALPLEAHFASVRSRVCVAVAHRHAPDHFDVVLAVAAMLYAVACASAPASCIVSALSKMAVDIERSSPLSQWLCGAYFLRIYKIES